MQLLLDNILASILGATVFLILVTINHRSQVATVEANSYFAMKKHEVSFIKTMASDFQNVRQVLTKDGGATYGGTANTFAFVADVRTSATDMATSTRTIQYRRVQVGTRTLDGTTYPAYRIDRYVDGALDGRSMATIAEWQVVARNADDQPVTQVSLDQAEAISISFEAFTPFIQEAMRHTIPLTQWETTFRPRMLRDPVL